MIVSAVEMTRTVGEVWRLRARLMASMSTSNSRPQSTVDRSGSGPAADGPGGVDSAGPCAASTAVIPNSSGRVGIAARAGPDGRRVGVSGAELGDRILLGLGHGGSHLDVGLRPVALQQPAD